MSTQEQPITWDLSQSVSDRVTRLDECNGGWARKPDCIPSTTSEGCGNAAESLRESLLEDLNRDANSVHARSAATPAKTPDGSATANIEHEHVKSDLSAAGSISSESVVEQTGTLTRHDVVSHPFTSELIRIKSHQLCRRTDIPCSDLEDIKQDMYLYLCKKAHLFNPARGNVEAFVTMAITSWIGMHLRHRRCSKRYAESYALPLERTFIECDGDATPLAALLRESDHGRRLEIPSHDAIDEFEILEAVEHARRQLTAEERVILDHVALHGVASAARKHDVSRRQIDNALRRMRSTVQDSGLGVD